MGRLSIVQKRAENSPLFLLITSVYHDGKIHILNIFSAQR